MRIAILIGLAAVASAVFAPEQGAVLTRSAMHGFGGALGGKSRIAFSANAIGDAGGG